MSVAVASVSTAENTDTCALPDGTVEGDLLIMATGYHQSVSDAVVFPDGSTVLWDDHNAYHAGWAWRLATAADVAAGSLTVDGHSPFYQVIGVLRITGFDAGAPIDVHAESLGAASATVTWPDVTTTVADDLILLGAARQDSDWDFTVTPSGFVTDLNVAARTAENGSRLAMFHATAAATGVYAPPSGTYGSSAFSTFSITIAIAPAASATAPSVSATGIDSAEAFGNPSITTVVTLSPPSLSNDTAFGVAAIAPGTLTVSAQGIPSVTSFGTALLRFLRDLNITIGRADPSNWSTGIADAGWATKPLDDGWAFGRADPGWHDR